jgi:WD40 repeat protein
MVVSEDRLIDAKVAAMIPTAVLARRWPSVDAAIRSWQMYGVGELATHWSPRARGVERDAVPGRYFSGRTAALSELVTWLRAPSADGRVRVVTGGPGSGKSALLARLVTLADPRHGSASDDECPEDTVPPRGSIDVAVHARKKTIDDLVRAMARAAEVEADSPDALIEALLERGRPFTVVVDALDEATEPEQIAHQLLLPLAADGAREGVRVLVGTRPGLRHELAYALGAGAIDLDLDDPCFLERADIAAYVHRRLLLADDPNAHTPYRGCEELASQVAEGVAARAYPSFLIAQLVSRSLVQMAPGDARVPRIERFPDSVADAMELYLSRFGDEKRRVRELLIPLAYAEGAGLPCDSLWASLASRLGNQEYGVSDVRWLLASAADYLVERAEARGEATYRLYHEALIECLRPPKDEEAMQGRYTEALIDSVPTLDGTGERDWLTAHPYVKTELATHAAAAGRLDALIVDPRFLLAAQASRLLHALPTATTSEGRRAADVYRTAVHQLRGRLIEEAASYLELHARRLRADELAKRIGDLALPRPWSTRWAQCVPLAPHRVIRQEDGVNAMAVGKLDGHLVAVSGGDGTLGVWDLATGLLMGDPLTGHEGEVKAVAVTQLDGRPVAVSGGEDGTLRMWDLATSSLIGDPLTGHEGEVKAVVVTQLDGRPVAVSGGEDGTLRVWDLTTGVLIGIPLTGHDKAVSAVAVTELEGRQIAISGGDDSTVRVWDLTTGNAVGAPLTSHEGPVTAVAVGKLDDRLIAVSAGWDDDLRVWDLSAGSLIRTTTTTTTAAGDFGIISAVAVGELHGRLIAVSGDYGGDMRAWDLATGSLIHILLTGHELPVSAVAVTELDGHPVVVSGGWDSSLRVWDLRTDSLIGAPLTAHEGGVTAVALAKLHGRPIVVSGGWDATLRVWDLGTGSLIGDPLGGDQSCVASVAVAELDGRLLVVSGDGTDGTLRVWDLATRSLIGDPLSGHRGGVAAVAVGKLDGRLVAVSGGEDGTLRVWDLATSRLIGDPLAGHDGAVTAVAVGKLDGRPLAVSGGKDGTLRLWDLATGRLIGDPLTGHDGAVTAVTMTELDDVSVAVSVSSHGTLRVWDLAIGGLIGSPFGDEVMAVAVGEFYGRSVAVSGSALDSLQVWDLPSGALRKTIDVDMMAAAVALMPPSTVVFGGKFGLVALDL